MDTTETIRLRKRIVELEQENTRLRKSCGLQHKTGITKKCRVMLGKHVFEEPGSYYEVRKRYPYADIEEI